MPAGPGETLLTTLFADIHYHFSPPTSRPQHHRFSKASYLYLFNNPNAHQAKIEVANHAGTPDQDAFSGYLSSARISYSHKQPTLFTIIIDASTVQTQQQWHIPSYDESNQQKYLYKIHTLDIYLWTEKDATTLLNHLKTMIPADRLDIKDAPPASRQQSTTPAEHRDSMSPVVQHLEKTAIASHFPPRAESTASAQSFPGPPTPASTAATSPPPAAQQPAPMAYNPAAPAAPETVIYREKTPPPLDDGSGTGLGNAAKYDAMPPQQQHQYANIPQGFQSQHSTPQQSYFPGPPSAQFPGPPPPQGGQQQRTHSGSSLPPPPPPPGGPSPSNLQPSFASPPTSPPPNQAHFNNTTTSRRQSSFGPLAASSGLPGPPQYANYNPHPTTHSNQPTPSFGPGALASPGLPGTPGQYGGQQYQPQAASSSAGGGAGANNWNSLHGEVYTPSAAEVAANPKLAGLLQGGQQQVGGQGQGGVSGVGGQGGGVGGQQGQAQGLTMGGRVDAYEKKVGGFLKRLDRKFGV